MSSGSSISNRHSPVNHQRRAGNEAGRRQHEAKRCVGDLLRLGVAAQCRSAVGTELLGLIGDPLGDSGVNRARANTVDGDTFFAKIHGHCPG